MKAPAALAVLLGIGGLGCVSVQAGDEAPPNARSPDYSAGLRSEHSHAMGMPDDAAFAMLLIDQLEAARDNHGEDSQFLDAQFRYGTDFDKLWLKVEGEFAARHVDDLRSEALWDHAVTPWWSLQAGVREDSAGGPSRTWAAVGVQGLAPYWLATELTGYVGDGGRTAARLQLEYDARLTQRLVLQPRLEAELYGKADPQRELGAGLSSTELGLRLRYEIRREFAPYLGLAWRQRYGGTADLNRAAENPTSEMQIVLGLHAWL